MDLYSRMVAFFKVLLPLAALAILATLFLLSRGNDPDTAIPFAEKDVADRLRDQQITAPFFSGTAPNGDEIIVTATLARPGGQDTPAEATDVSARITAADGGRMTLDADKASVDLPADLATFSGDVRISTSTGYVVRTEELNTRLHDLSGSAPGTIKGTGPLGDFTAGQMEFSAKNQSGPVHMLFKGGVKLIYQPKQIER
ncbi:hypothetical protein ACXYMO_14155 [Arenibacterium sp. CAU 1754]